VASQFNFLTRTLSDPFWPQIIMGLCQSISSLNFAKNPSHQHDPFARHLLLKSHQLFSHPWCRCWACKRGDPDPPFFVLLTKCNCLLKTLRLFSKTNRLYYKHSTRAALFAFSSHFQSDNPQLRARLETPALAFTLASPQPSTRGGQSPLGLSMTCF